MPSGLILAAGAGRRFATSSGGGAIKQLAPFRGRPLLQWAIDAHVAVPELSRVVVVLGAGAATILGAVDLGGAEAVVCPNWRAGISASLKAGMRALAEQDRVIVTLGDQPLITAAVIRGFLTEPPGTRATHDGVPGHPVVLGHRHRAGVEALTGDRGAVALLRGARLIELGSPATADVDTMADLKLV